MMRLPYTWRPPVFFYMKEPGILAKDGELDYRKVLSTFGLKGDMIVYRYLSRRQALGVAAGLIRRALLPERRYP